MEQFINSAITFWYSYGVFVALFSVCLALSSFAICRYWHNRYLQTLGEYRFAIGALVRSDLAKVNHQERVIEVHHPDYKQPLFYVDVDDAADIQINKEVI